MNISQGLPSAPLPQWPVLTIGNFDGQHRGHHHLLSSVVSLAQARNGTPMVLTFDPHPIQVLRPGMNLRFLSPPSEKFHWFEHMGVSHVVVLPFTIAFAELSPQGFVYQILRDGIGVREILVGSKFVFGKGRAGNIDMLHQLAQKAGFQVHSIDPINVGDVVVSSTRIRRLVHAGEMEEAQDCLGRPFSLAGLVIEGAQRGAALGYRTANLRLPTGRVIPPDGVYVTRTIWQGSSLDSVSYIGTRPTFGEGERRLEVHLLDQECALYGEEITIQFMKRLRGDQTFETADDLSARIALDVRLAKDVLSRC